MEGLKKNRAGQTLALAGLLIMAVGGIFYSVSLQLGVWGLYASGAGLVLLLVSALVSRRRLAGLFGSRYGRMGLTSSAAIVAVIALALFAGSLLSRHHVRWDFSEGGVNSLASQTVKVLKKLDQPVKAYAFFREQDREQLGQVLTMVQSLLDQYKYHNSRFSYEIIDPIAQPGLARKYDVRQPATVVMESNGKNEKVTEPGEKSFTNALIRVTARQKKKVYFLTLHGEKQIEDSGDQGLSQLVKNLTAEGLTVAKLQLATLKEVPGDAACVVIAGPAQNLDGKELDRLGRYLKRGGGVAVALDPMKDGGMTKWLATWGIEVGNNLVVDLKSQEFNVQPWVVVADIGGEDEITKPLAGVGGVFVLARMVKAADKPAPGVTAKDMFTTSTQAWAKTDMKLLTQSGDTKVDMNYQAGKDIKGPIALAALATIQGDKPKGAAKTDPAPKGRLVVFGDSDFLANASLKLFGNADLALNTVNYLTLESDLISIRPKGTGNQPLMLTHTQVRLVMWLPVVVLPLLLLVLGVVVWNRRRAA